MKPSLHPPKPRSPMQRMAQINNLGPCMYPPRRPRTRFTTIHGVAACWLISLIPNYWPWDRRTFTGYMRFREMA